MFFESECPSFISSDYLGKFGVINERSKIDAQVLISGCCLGVERIPISSGIRPVVFVRDCRGRIYETYEDCFVTDRGAIETLQRKLLNKQYNFLKVLTRLEGQIYTREHTLIKQAVKERPYYEDVKAMRLETSLLEYAEVDYDYYKRKLDILNKSIENIDWVLQLDSVRYETDSNRKVESKQKCSPKQNKPKYKNCTWCCFAHKFSKFLIFVKETLKQSFN